MGESGLRTALAAGASKERNSRYSPAVAGSIKRDQSGVVEIEASA
jgi:hypothetical protein